MKVKKICPNCRKNITSSVRSLVLDNYIDKVTKVLSKEMQEHREKLVEERKSKLKLHNSDSAMLYAPKKWTMTGIEECSSS